MLHSFRLHRIVRNPHILFEVASSGKFALSNVISAWDAVVVRAVVCVEAGMVLNLDP